MVRAIENWTDLSGAVEAVGPAPGRDGFVRAAIRVTGALDVEGSPNLFSDAVGEVVEVLVPASTAEVAGLRAGAAVACRVRRADATTTFSHPDVLAVDDGGPTPEGG